MRKTLEDFDFESSIEYSDDIHILLCSRAPPSRRTGSLKKGRTIFIPLGNAKWHSAQGFWIRERESIWVQHVVQLGYPR